MVHAMDIGELLDNRKAICMGIAVMHNDRQRQPLRQRHLRAECRLLFFTRRRGLRRLLEPVVIQSDLSDCLNLVLA